MLCPLIVALGSPVMVSLQAEIAEPLGAYDVWVALPPGVTVMDVTAADPFLVVWNVEDGYLKTAGWQVTAQPTGTVPIWTATLSSGRGDDVFDIGFAQVFDTSIQEVPMTGGLCETMVVSPQRLRAARRHG